MYYIYNIKNNYTYHSRDLLQSFFDVYVENTT